MASQQTVKTNTCEFYKWRFSVFTLNWDHVDGIKLQWHEEKQVYGYKKAGWWWGRSKNTKKEKALRETVGSQ